MKKATIWLIIGAVLLLIGVILFTGVMKVAAWDFSKLSTINYVTNNYDITESYNNISIISDTADINLLPSENGKTLVVCYEQKKMAHSVSVTDNTLKISVVDTRKWYDYIGISFGTPKITVYIPKGEYEALSIKESTGDIKIPQDFYFESIDILASTGDIKNYASAKNTKIKTDTGDILLEKTKTNLLSLSVSTGNIKVLDVACEGDIRIKVSTGHAKLIGTTCQNLISSGNTGDIYFENVIASQKLNVDRSTGDIKFEKCDAGELSIKTDTGDVRGSLLSEKVFFAQTDTGKINIPKTTSGGKCEINTSTGDIKISLTP